MLGSILDMDEPSMIGYVNIILTNEKINNIKKTQKEWINFTLARVLDGVDPANLEPYSAPVLKV